MSFRCHLGDRVLEVEYEVYGGYRPQTFDSPAEYPEVECESIMEVMEDGGLVPCELSSDELDELEENILAREESRRKDPY